jgi:hypothetical protein
VPSTQPWLSGRKIANFRAKATAAAIKTVIAHQLASEMKKRQVQTGRALIDRLLDPNNASATIENLKRAAKILDRKILGPEPKLQQV